MPGEGSAEELWEQAVAELADTPTQRAFADLKLQAVAERLKETMRGHKPPGPIDSNLHFYLRDTYGLTEDEAAQVFQDTINLALRDVDAEKKEL